MNLFDIANEKSRLKELEEQTKENDFWNDQEKSAVVLQKIKILKDKVSNYDVLNGNLEDIHAMIELIEEANDESLIDELKQDVKKFEKGLDRLEIEALLSGPHDANNAIVTIHPGAGGTESQDWAEMLYRMYSMWCDKNGYKLEELDYLDGDVAGLKSVTFTVTGPYAYGYLKCEKGVHRLVRLSPFDSNNRRHTSFASVDVTPIFETSEINIEINPNDLKIDVYRSSGCGGQGVNTTDSAVRITHLPTKIVVTCQNERSQIQNKERALEVLKSKLYKLELDKRNQDLKEIKGELSDINFGSQIRSYVMHPYSLVKDNRTGTETSNVQKVLDGDLDMFINDNLKKGC